MSPTLTTGPGSSTSFSPLLSWTPCWKENFWRNTLEGQLGSRRPPIFLVLRSCHRLRLLLEGYYQGEYLLRKSCYIQLWTKPIVKMFWPPLWYRCHYFWLHPLPIHESQGGWQLYFAKSHRDFSLSAVLRKLGVIQRVLTEYSHQSLGRK